MSLSNTAETALLNAFVSLYPTLYLALSTADPGETGSGIAEPSTGGYVRQPVGSVTVSGSMILNNASIAFPIATSAWGTITHVALFTAETGGTFLGYGSIEAINCVANTRVIVSDGEIILSLD